MGRDHARTRRMRGVTAEAKDLSLLQYAQDLRLGFGRHVTDLVEKDRALIGGLELARPRFDAGRDAFLDPEQLGLEQIFGQRGAVDGHQRLRSARRGVVNEARQHLLAGARLAVDQHPHVAAGHALGLIVDALHRRIDGQRLRPIGRRRRAHRRSLRRPVALGQGQHRERRVDDRAIVLAGVLAIESGPHLKLRRARLDPIGLVFVRGRALRGIEHALFLAAGLDDFDPGHRHGLEQRVAHLLGDALAIGFAAQMIQQTRQVIEGEPVERTEGLGQLTDVEGHRAAEVGALARHHDADLEIIVGDLLEQHHHPADDEDVADRDRGALDALGIEQRAVGGAQVFELDAGTGHGDHRVTARDRGIRQTDLAARVRADRVATAMERGADSLVVKASEQPVCHLRPTFSHMGQLSLFPDRSDERRKRPSHS